MLINIEIKTFYEKLTNAIKGYRTTIEDNGGVFMIVSALKQTKDASFKSALKYLNMNSSMIYSGLINKGGQDVL